MLDYALINIKLRAVLTLPDFSDVVHIPDIIGFSSSFAINTIPTATLSIAVGKLAKVLGDPQFATIHSLQPHMTTQSIVRVYMNSSLMRNLSVQKTNAPPAGKKEKVPKNELSTELGVPADGKDMLIFQGRLSGIGRSSSAQGTAVATLYLEHWLTNLNYASAISSSSNPGNPNDMIFSAVYRARAQNKDASGLDVAPVSWLPIASKTLVNQATMSDIWKEVLHPWMVMAATADPFVAEIKGSISSKTPLTGDKGPILDALERMGANPQGKPLKVSTRHGVAGRALINGIKASLIGRTGTNWINTTLWGKLVSEWAPEYFFSVIPRIEDALIVPFTGPIEGDPWAVIGNEDYIFAKTDIHVPQLLRGVGIVHPSGSSSGFNQRAIGSVNVSWSGFAGYYISEQTPVGMLLLKYPPSWLANQHRAGQYGRVGEAAGPRAAVESVFEREGDVKPAGTTDGAEEKANIKEIRNFMSLYAKQWYALERLKGRTGEVAGKLRFDICPGSNIRVEADAPATGVNGVTVMQEFYATVMQVNYVFDVEGQRAGTSFQVAHVHTVDEHKPGTDLVVKDPPIYQDAWLGAPMHVDAVPEVASTRNPQL